MQTQNNNPVPLQKGIYTLAQSGTRASKNKPLSVTVSGNGSDLLDKSFMRKKAKKKLITQATILKLIDIAKEQGDNEKLQRYWNTFHCQNKLISNNYRIYGKYCKNRFCTTCCGNRKADLINKYYPVLKKWEDPHFVTLTFRSVSAKDLRKYFKGMKTNFRKIIERCKKRHQRGKGIKVMGIKSLEANFNPKRKTYNPHFHIIVPNIETAKLLKSEWLIQNRPKNKGSYKFKYANPKAQHLKRIENIEEHLVEVIKYGTKIFTDAEVNKKDTVTAPMIYIKALDTIYNAMQDIRLFDRFGFNLPPKKQKLVSTELMKYDRWEYNNALNDWINPITGEILSGFVPPSELEFLLENQMNSINF